MRSILMATTLVALFNLPAQAEGLADKLKETLKDGCNEQSADMQAKLDEAQSKQQGLGGKLFSAISDEVKQQLGGGCEQMDTSKQQ
ncbi:hypothetical protein [Metapseudomonas resinovorans]|nr:hypothetical protein [Pseudomonas resinovorans]